MQTQYKLDQGKLRELFSEVKGATRADGTVLLKRAPNAKYEAVPPETPEHQCSLAVSSSQWFLHRLAQEAKRKLPSDVRKLSAITRIKPEQRLDDEEKAKIRGLFGVGGRHSKTFQALFEAPLFIRDLELKRCEELGSLLKELSGETMKRVISDVAAGVRISSPDADENIVSQTLANLKSAERNSYHILLHIIPVLKRVIEEGVGDKPQDSARLQSLADAVLVDAKAVFNFDNKSRAVILIDGQRGWRRKVGDDSVLSR